MIGEQIWWSEPKNVLIISGPSNTGKSQFLQQVIVESMMPVELQGKGYNVIYLETRMSVKPRRILDRIEDQVRRVNVRIPEDQVKKLSEEVLKDKLMMVRVYSWYELNKFRELLEETLRDQRMAMKKTVFVIDCLASFYWESSLSVDYSARLTHAREVFDAFFAICQEHGCALVAGFRYDEDVDMVVNRMYLQMKKEGGEITYKATMYKEGDNLTKEVNYRINEKGIVWIKKK